MTSLLADRLTGWLWPAPAAAPPAAALLAAGPELEAGDVDYLSTTPPELLNTIENVLALYDGSRRQQQQQGGGGGMAGDAAALMNPEVS